MQCKLNIFEIIQIGNDNITIIRHLAASHGKEHICHQG